MQSRFYYPGGVGLRHLPIVLSSLPVGFVFAGPVAAQTATEPVMLSEINVQGEQANGPVQGYRATRTGTATKTDTAIRDTPQSIQVVPRDVIIEQQDVRLSDVLQNVSNVQPGGTLQGRSDTFILRGFNTQTYAIDGVLMNPANNFQDVIRDLANAERVEVLKGPASVLYGRGDPGGLINIVTRQPTLTPSGDATISGGSFGFKRFQGSASSQLFGIDGLAGRLTFSAQDDPTFRNYSGQHNQRYFIAPSISWIPSADTRVYLTGEFTQQYSQYDEGLIAVNGHVPVGMRTTYYGEPWSRYEGTANTVTLRAEHDFNPGFTMRQIANAQWGSFDFFTTRATGVTGNTVARRDTAGFSVYRSIDTQTEGVLKFDTFGLKNTGLVGFEYINGYRNPTTLQGSVASIDLLKPVYGAVGGTMVLQSVLQQTMRMYGTYVQDQVDLTHGFQLVAGVRFDALNQFYWNKTTTTAAPPADQNQLGISPRAGLIYRPWEPIAFYASYTTSFTPQTANVLNISNPVPETGQQYEVGARADLIPDKLSASFAAFLINRQNVAASDPVNSGYSVITGAQRSKGLEMDVSGEIKPGWKVIGGVGYTDATVSSDTTFKVGNWLIGVPRISGSVWSTYQFQEGPLKGFGFGAGVTYVGLRYGDLNNSYSLGQYARLDATVFYDFNEHYRFAVNARNLTNTYYIEQSQNQFNNQPGAPLSVIASLTGRF